MNQTLRYCAPNMSDTVLLKIEGPRATITLNDPAKHNRLDPAGLGKLRAAIEKADADPAVRVTVLTGTGDVLEPEKHVMGIGSGGNYALAAARALLDQPLSAEEIARKAMAIAADICVYTNHTLTLETL